MNVDIDRRHLRVGAAVGGVVVVFAAFAAVAFLGWGPLAAGLFVGALVVGAVTPPVAILLFREVIPNIAAVGLAIAAQVAFGQAGLVRREDGRYEWGLLREDADGGYYVELDAGGRVPIDADAGELFSFGFGELAVAEAHGRNLEPYRVEHNPVPSDAPADRRAGIGVEQPRQEGDNTILVTLAKIQRRVRGSASSTLVRRGRDKALDEQGGTGQLSPLWTMAFAVVLLIVSFGMTATVLML